METLCTFNRKNRIENSMFYLLGVFSTMQIVTLLGNTVFMLLVYAMCIYLVVSKGQIYILDKLVIVYTLVIVLTTVYNVAMNVISKPYQGKAISSLINVVAIIVVYIYGSNKDNISCFLKGFELSCKIQLVWCILQFVFHKFLDIPLNTVVFNEWLPMSEQTVQLRNGEYVCTGLHWHASNMIIILAYLYLFSKSWLVKVLSIFIVIQTSNTTAMIALVFCFVCEIVVVIYRLSKRWLVKINLEKKVIVLMIVLGGILIGKEIVPTIVEMIDAYVYRFTALSGELQGGNDDVGISSMVHLSYYLNLPDMLSNSSIVNVLIGYGLSCSGYLYSELYGQYKELVWVIESDIINNIINLGIVGFTIFTLLMGRILFYIKKIGMNYKYCIFILSIFICGITYNVQQLWVFVLILMLYAYVRDFRILQNDKH